jgi:hypothetical protein
MQGALPELGDDLLRLVRKWGGDAGFHIRDRSDALSHNNRKVEEIADFWPLSECQKSP